MALGYFGFGEHHYVFLNPLMLKEAPYVKSCNCFNLTIFITKTRRLFLSIQRQCQGSRLFINLDKNSSTNAWLGLDWFFLKQSPKAW